MIASTKSVQLPGGPRLSYIEQGDASGCPVLLLHGVSDSCRSFARLLPYLRRLYEFSRFRSAGTATLNARQRGMARMSWQPTWLLSWN